MDSVTTQVRAGEPGTEVPRPRGADRPYVSPFARKTIPEERTYPKPWMKPRPGESESDRLGRLHHSCAHCGRYEPDLEKLTRHEDSAHGQEK